MEPATSIIIVFLVVVVVIALDYWLFGDGGCC